LAINNVKNDGIKINKIYYSDNNGNFIKISPKKLLKKTDHHISKFFKNNPNYKPGLNCCDDCGEDEEIEVA